MTAKQTKGLSNERMNDLLLLASSARNSFRHRTITPELKRAEVPRTPTSRRCDLGPLEFAVEMIERVCRMAGDATFLDHVRAEKVLGGAIRSHDTAALFNWLMSTLSYQGISDQVARGYMDRHGRAKWRDIKYGLFREGLCAKLRGYWCFHGCLYDKGSQTCAEPDGFPGCPLPKIDLRNGRLNQTAFSLFLFIRDVADGDVVGWLDHQMAAASRPGAPDGVRRMREAIIGPLRYVYGVSDKTLAMALSDLLLNAPRSWFRWHEVGASMVAVDTLVHNWLHRTGILRRYGTNHRYGPACYRPGGCAEIVEQVASKLDARQFNPSFPKRFPRFVQHAIWRFCAQDGLDTCNGNRINDSKKCQNKYCRLYSICDRISLISAQMSD